MASPRKGEGLVGAGTTEVGEEPVVGGRGEEPFPTMNSRFARGSAQDQGWEEEGCWAEERPGPSTLY